MDYCAINLKESELGEYKWDVSLKIHLKEIAAEGMDWIYLIYIQGVPGGM